MSLATHRKHKAKGWVVTTIVHALLLLIMFFYVVWQEQIPPPDPGLGFELAFGLEEISEGTENDLTSAASSEQIQEEVVEEQTAQAANSAPSESQDENTDPLESQDLVEQQQDVIEAQENTEQTNTEVEETTPSDSQSDSDSQEETQQEEQAPSGPNLGDLGDFNVGGGNPNGGQAGDPNGTHTVSLGNGQEAVLPNGWGLVREPRPKVKKNGAIVIKVKFDAGGKYIPNSAECISGSCIDLFEPNLSVIEESLQSELELKSDGKTELKNRNTAKFKFVFKAE